MHSPYSFVFSLFCFLLVWRGVWVNGLWGGFLIGYDFCYSWQKMAASSRGLLVWNKNLSCIEIVVAREGLGKCTKMTR